MLRTEIYYLIPYFISLAISVGVFMIAWQRRKAPGVNAFIGYAIGQTFWLFGFILELVSPSLSSKIFWDGFQWLAGQYLVIALPIFAVQYTEHKLKNQQLLFRLSLIAPALFTALLATDSAFHWIYINPRLSNSMPFQELLYDYSPAVYIYAIYSFFIFLWALSLLAQRIIRPHGLYRTQVILITLGFFIPILGAALSLFNTYLTPQRDATPFTTIIGNLLIILGLFRFRVFDIVPIARERVFEAMVEPVVILDNQNNVVDINASMLVLLGKNANEVIGEPAKEIFDDFPIPIKMYMHVSYARAEATFLLGGKNIYYELTVWPLFNSSKEMTGRIYISHDITALKELENELRKLNTELEDRVRARTWELADAYDTTLEGWARALEIRDKETEGHSRRVTDMTLKIAIAMGITDDDLEQIRRGAILHDIGKMGISDEILHKPGKLTDEERETIKTHPGIAYKLLAPIPFLKKALEIPYSHHEKWDGTGYPLGLAGEDIPLSARIFAITDVWDALTSDRSYNKAWEREKVIAYFVEQTGKHFDPRVINVFFRLLEKGDI